MEDFKADILLPNRRGVLLFYTLVIVVMLVLATVVYFEVIPVIFQLFSLMIWGFVVLRYILQTKKKVFKKTSGVLKITGNDITVPDATYQLSEIKSIQVFFSGWKSFKRSHDRSRPISEFHSGDKNLLIIATNSGKIKCEFLLTSKEHWELLRVHVINWYRRNLIITENSEHGKTYGLRMLSYREIQDFKRDLETQKIGTP